MIIVNADDFGYSPAVNKAIDLCFKSKIISSTTIMMNMPFAEEAIAMAKGSTYSDKIGLHFNLIEGKALSPMIKSCGRLCDSEGNFIYKRNTIWLWTKVERKAIKEEFQAQLDALKKSNINPTHVDSHQHVHTELPIYMILRKCLKSNKIDALRISRNLGVCKRNLLYKKVVNFFMRLDGFRITNYMQEYGSYDLERVGADIELMCHPIWDMGKIVDSVTGTIIERKIGNLVNYSDL